MPGSSPDQSPEVGQAPSGGEGKARAAGASGGSSSAPGAGSHDDDPFFIRVEGLRKRLGRQRVLRGVDLVVERGKTLVILGGSGSGKSVFLKHLLGLMKGDAGRIQVDGVDITDLGERELGPTRRKIGILFQDGALFDSMSVGENVGFPLRESGVRDRGVVAERVKEVLGLVGLEGQERKMPINLSGGMRKRVALARAIICEPKCILYDEPTAGLDPVGSGSINRLIRGLQRKLDITSVVVTHDMNSVYHIADRVAYLRDGRVYFEGSVTELKESRDPLVRSFVEGRDPEAEAEAEAD